MIEIYLHPPLIETLELSAEQRVAQLGKKLFTHNSQILLARMLECSHKHTHTHTHTLSLSHSLTLLEQVQKHVHIPTQQSAHHANLEVPW